MNKLINYNLLSIQREIEATEKEFKKFENTITDIDVFVFWLDTKTKLYKSVKYKILEHTFVSSFIATYVNVENITELITYNSLAKKALIEFNEINLSKENEIINWIIKYENNSLLIPIGYEETENWKTTNFILFKNSVDIFQENHKIYDNIVVDVKEYNSSLEFRNVYEQYSEIYLDKYYPTKVTVAQRYKIPLNFES
jgi:hypothetical protein